MLSTAGAALRLVVGLGAVLEDLERRWQDSVLLSGICGVVREHAEKHFGVYVRYCSNQVYQDRILKKLM